jgi:hypothetical protein
MWLVIETAEHVDVVPIRAPTDCLHHDTENDCWCCPDVDGRIRVHREQTIQ